jgi:carbon dioxide concentrating mechanism protein CcmK
MAIAVGMVEVLGHPPALAVADAMTKAARVTLVGYEVVSGARITIIVRGDVAEVQTAVNRGVEEAKTIEKCSAKDKSLFLSSNVIPRPHENVEVVIRKMRFNSTVERFR